MNQRFPVAQGPAPQDHVHARAQPNSVDNGALQPNSVTTDKVADGTLLVGDLNSSVYGLVGSISVIDPDDAASAGVATTLARADHQHAATAAAAAALTETHTSAEGSASDWARSDHVHSTQAMAWGLLAAPTARTTAAGPTSGTTELDLAVDVTATITSGRRARIEFTFRSVDGTTAGDVFELRFKEAGTQVMAFHVTIEAPNQTSDGRTISHTYTPTAGSRTFEVFLVRTAGTGTATLQAAATYPATLSVFDAGG